ncbi:hypothetical protein [Salinibacterium sp. ZJ454]|uniref:hypothetical protein n=1 Tax=Salinibacterium sp. ZJ454 TaxID=2708339 RepID=UPI001420412B|nr:hypothetical protein [Salinibacterium sp. ZJ454]
MTSGISQSAQDSMHFIPQTVELLRRGDYNSAEGTALGAVNAFRMGGDKGLLPLALALRSVALGANGKFDSARKAVDEAEALSRTIPPRPPRFQDVYDDVRPMILSVQRELHRQPPDSSRLVEYFLELNDAA